MGGASDRVRKLIAIVCCVQHDQASCRSSRMEHLFRWKRGQRSLRPVALENNKCYSLRVP
jgi:hypothetical protein